MRAVRGQPFDRNSAAFLRQFNLWPSQSIINLWFFITRQTLRPDNEVKNTVDVARHLFLPWFGCGITKTICWLSICKTVHNFLTGLIINPNARTVQRPVLFKIGHTRIAANIRKAARDHHNLVCGFVFAFLDDAFTVAVQRQKRTSKQDERKQIDRKYSRRQR